MISLTFPDNDSFGGRRHPEPTLYEDITVPDGQITTLNRDKLKKCVGALVKFEGGPFRQRMDAGKTSGVSLTSGYLRGDGDEFFFSRSEASFFTCILDTGAGAVSGTLRVTYYG